MLQSMRMLARLQTLTRTRKWMITRTRWRQWQIGTWLNLQSHGHNLPTICLNPTYKLKINQTKLLFRRHLPSRFVGEGGNPLAIPG